MKENERSVNQTKSTDVENKQPNVKPEVKESKEAQNKQQSTKQLKGVVVNCDMLNIRNTPENVPDNIKGTVARGTEVIIDESKSTDTYYKVKVEKNNSVGYCMKQFIQAK